MSWTTVEKEDFLKSSTCVLQLSRWSFWLQTFIDFHFSVDQKNVYVKTVVELYVTVTRLVVKMCLTCGRTT